MRSIAWRLDPAFFGTYAETGKFCTHFLQTGKRATIANVQEELQKFKEGKIPEKPELPDFLKDPFNFYEIDEVMSNLKETFVPRDIQVRSAYSDIPEFVLSEYEYERTFQGHVDNLNLLVAANEMDKYGSLYWVTVEYDAGKNIYYLWLHQEGEMPPSALQVPVIPKIGKGKVKGKKKEKEGVGIDEKLKEAELRNKKLETLRKSLEILNKQQDKLISDIVKYKGAGLQKEFLKASERLSKLNDEIDLLNRRIINLSKT